MKFTQATAALLATLSAVQAAPACSCCKALSQEKSLEGKVLAKDSAAYEERLQHYYSVNAAQHAWCMVMPESTEEVQTVAKILSSKNCPFGIRAGAHSAWKGSNGIKDGVTVDLSHLNGTTYDPETRIASIAPGGRWGPVYEALDKYNVTVAGARTSVVGIGGFATGGGYTFHSNEAGLTCDNVVNWEIVLGDGTVVNANENENADLWKAQKGGSGNLGFVTRMDMSTLEGNQMWAGFTEYDLKERDALFNAYINFVLSTPESSPSQSIVAMYHDKTGYALRSILSNTDGVSDDPAFNEYFAIPNITSTLASGPEKEIIPQFSGPTPLGLYANWFTGLAVHSFENLLVLDELHKEYVPKMEAAAPGADFSTLVDFQPLTKAIVDHSNQRGGNILGLERVVRDRPAVMWLVSLTVDTEENQEKILPICREFVDAINQRLRQQNGYIDWVYLNYAWMDQKPYSHYGDENLQFLHDVSSKYDPQGIFNRLHQTGFKLPEAN